MRYIAALFLLTLGFALPTSAQQLERTSHESSYNPRQVQDTRDLKVLQAIQDEIKAEYTQPCGNHPHGSTWTEPCLAPVSNGVMTKTCLSGIAVLKSATCTE